MPVPPAAPALPGDAETADHIHLQPTWFLDSDDAAVARYAAGAARGAGGVIARACALYYAVRDGVRYNPYGIDVTREGFRASACLGRGSGFCISKAALLAACARAAGIPSRLGFGDVRNHMTTAKLRAAMGTDVFVFHGYTELRLGGRWVRATPAFNKELCERVGVAPLEFDGRADSLLQAYDSSGSRYMEYVRDRGHFDDLPYDTIMAAWAETYPAAAVESGFAAGGGDFGAEAARERTPQEDRR